MTYVRLRNCAERCSQLCYDKVYEAKVSDKTSNLLFLNLDRILPPHAGVGKEKEPRVTPTLKRCFFMFSDSNRGILQRLGQVNLWLFF